MARLVALVFVLALIYCGDASPDGTIDMNVDDGKIGIAVIAGGTFGPGSFSIGGPGTVKQAEKKGATVNDGDGDHVILQNQADNQRRNNQPPQRGNGGESGGLESGHRGNVQRNRLQAKPTQGSAGQGSSGGGSVIIGTVVLSDNKRNKGGERSPNNNKQPISYNADALDTIFGGNAANNGFPSSENENFGAAVAVNGNIAIGLISGGKFKPESFSTDNNKKPIGAKGKVQNNGNTGNLNANSDGGAYSSESDEQDVWVWN